MSRRILIAGIGNIFHGDDAFGVEVARQLSGKELPEGVSAIDFGIRSYDLAYALMDGHDAVILVDATLRGQAPGTVYLIEPDLDAGGQFDAEAANAHGLNPQGVLQMVQSLGGKLSGRIYLVGCEPAVLETDNGELGLSASVQAAVPQAVELIQSLVDNLVSEHQEPGFQEAHKEELVPCVTQEK